AVLSAGRVAGQTVLVQGGSGAVGRMSIEMAKRGGADVIATAGTAERLALARQAGADCVLNYRSDDVAAAVLERTGGRGADLIVEVDFGANAATDGACVAENGRIASYSSTSNRTPVLDYYAFALKGVRLHFIQASNMPDALEAEASAAISALLAEGALRPPVAHVFGLDRAATAHALLESGQAGGKVVLDLQAPAGA
ncbi:MAG: zinc-binding dehydrogenase, partial [Pseudodonghicola sp.]